MLQDRGAECAAGNWSNQQFVQKKEQSSSKTEDFDLTIASFAVKEG